MSLSMSVHIQKSLGLRTFISDRIVDKFIQLILVHQIHTIPSMIISKIY